MTDAAPIELILAPAVRDAINVILRLVEEVVEDFAPDEAEAHRLLREIVPKPPRPARSSERPQLTDDPADPCAYCAGWIDNPDDDLGPPVPINPDGSRLERMYRRAHPRCQEAVNAYMADVRRENALYERGEAP